MKRRFTIRNSGGFGRYYDLDFPEAQCIIVCTNRGGGWEPRDFLLPHQLYVRDVKKMMEQLGDAYHAEVAVFPVSNPKDYITVASAEWKRQQRPPRSRRKGKR